VSYKLKQENFNKLVTAEAIKVLVVLADNMGHSLQLPGVTAQFTMSTVQPRNYNVTLHHGRRCHDALCFCTYTRLEANLIIKYMVRISGKRALLREWRDRRQQLRSLRRNGLLLNATQEVTTNA
jgi:hypothetical protein